MIANHSPNTDLLFEHFATLATAPDGIARLRELILQLAVQGKLGTQDAGDEPANVLLAKIRKNKELLVKESKIPKQQLKDNIEKRDHLPENWLYGPLGDFFYRVPVTKNKIPFTEFQKMGSIPIVDQSQNFIAGYTNQDSKLLTIPGPVIIFGDHTREIKYIDFNFVVGADGVIVLKPLNGYERYFYLVLKSLNLEDKGYSRHYKILSNYFFPLPPLAEQHRIVTKVYRLMAICDELEARQQQERAGCLNLGTASLAVLQNAESPEEFWRQWAQVCDAFDLIVDCPENVAVLRQTILQLAVQGLLVQQEQRDEPARVLEEKIRKEKVRLVKEGVIPKERDLDPVSKAEMPFALPNNWIWAKWNDISLQIQDVDHRMPTACSEGIPYISPRDFGPNNKIHFDTAKKISEADFDSLKTKIQPEKNDIIFPRYGTIGENRFIETDIEFLASYSCTTIKTLTGFVNPKYTFYFSISPLVRSQIEKSINKTTQANVGLKSIQNYLFPLPPLAEQHRIVAKVDALMALCDALESRLKERAGVQVRLVGAVVKQVTG